MIHMRTEEQRLAFRINFVLIMLILMPAVMADITLDLDIIDYVLVLALFLVIALAALFVMVKLDCPKGYWNWKPKDRKKETDGKQ